MAEAGRFAKRTQEVPSFQHRPHLLGRSATVFQAAWYLLGKLTRRRGQLCAMTSKGTESDREFAGVLGAGLPALNRLLQAGRKKYQRAKLQNRAAAALQAPR